MISKETHLRLRSFGTSLKSGEPQPEIMTPSQASKIKMSLTFSTAYQNLSVRPEVEQKITQTQNTNDKKEVALASLAVR